MTANQRYKKYLKEENGTLSFSEYMTREKTKGFMNFDGTVSIPVNQPLNDSIRQTLDKIHREAGLQTSLDGKYIFGINKNVWIGVGVTGVVIAAYFIYKHYKK